MLHIEELLEKRPAALSRGQRQLRAFAVLTVVPLIVVGLVPVGTVRVRVGDVVIRVVAVLVRVKSAGQSDCPGADTGQKYASSQRMIVLRHDSSSNRHGSRATRNRETSRLPGVGPNALSL